MSDRDEDIPADGGASLPSNAGRNAPVRMEASYSWSAPLPPPAVLKQYDQVFPGCAERIVALTEHQAAHRQSMESRVVHGNVSSQTTGLWLGFILALIVILSGTWLVYTGHIGWGAVFTSFPLVSLMSVFVIGKRQQSQQLSTHRGEAEAAQRELPFPE